jgi:hypothetical protein
VAADLGVDWVQICTKSYPEVVQVATRVQQPHGANMSESPLTISVPEAGRKYFGLSRNASYAAAARGDIPTIKIGKLLRVPVRMLDQMLDQPKAARAGGT